jgi:MFS family permease
MTGTRGPLFAAFAVRNFRLFMAGQAVSVAGNWMQNVAVGWLVLSLAGDGGVLGLIIACRYAPLLVLGSWGGLVVDRNDARTMLRITATGQAVISAAIGVLTLTGAIRVGSLAALVLAAGVADVFDSPARQTFFHNLVGRDRLPNAIALNSVVINTARVLGPGSAGFLIVSVGVGWCFLLNAASFLMVLACLQLVRRAELVASAVQERGRGQIRAGLRHVAGRRDLLAPLVLVTLAGAFAWEFPVSIPLIVSTTLGGDAQAYGVALGCLSAGAIVGGLIAARLQEPGPRTTALACLAWGVAILVAACAPALPALYVLLAPVGCGAVAFNALSKTVLQVRAAEQMRGRVMALWSTAWQGTTVVGAPAVGYVGDWFGGRAALGLGGVVTLLAGGVVLVLERRVLSREGRG